MIYDINLIPKNKKNGSGSGQFILLLIFLSCILIVGFFGLFMPYQKKNIIKKEVSSYEKEIEVYQENNSSYDLLRTGADRYSETISILDYSKSYSYQITEMLDAIEKNIPVNTYFKSMILSNGMLTLEGNTPSYTEIANFIINIREIDRVTNVRFTTAKLNEDTSEGENAAESHNFTLYISFDTIDVFSSGLPQVEPVEEDNIEEENSQSDNGQEAEENETYQ